ncbi:MAG: FAD-binding oxidoreductase [Spirochaetia bacterium]|nr:FAD-binding oxidoreductase [Spirochaetia bacterium]
MRMEKGILETVKTIGENLYYLKINLPLIAGEINPGNFISILPPPDSGKYIRRPFSAAGAEQGEVELIIKNTGPVTASLCRLKKGSEIDAMGPLGNTYSLKQKKLWMIGGGTGIASILFLNSSRFTVSLDRVLWAGKTAAALPPEKIMQDKYFASVFMPNICFATDDGTLGEKGTASVVLEKWLKEATRETGNNRDPYSGKSKTASGILPDAIVSCGPHGMMKGIKEIADNAGIPSWFSLEEFMACGAGACAGCAVPASGGGYLKACSDGPVFAGSEVIL